jgi:hypothetical protein
MPVTHHTRHIYVDDFMMANCGCEDVSFELAWEGIRAGLHGYLKTAGPREFLGTDVALTRVGAEDAVDLGVDFTGGTGRCMSRAPSL